MPLQFINAGQALKTYDDETKANAEQAWVRGTRERALRDDAQKQAVDAAVREGVARQTSALSNVQAEPEIVLTGDDEGNPNPEGPRVIKPAVPASQPSWRAPIVQRLARTPGGGQAALNLYGAEEKHQVETRRAASTERKEERELHYRGLEQFNKSMDAGDIDTARAINSQFRLGIPEQAFANQRVLARMLGISRVLNRSQIRGREGAELYKAALENLDAPLDQVLLKGMTAAAGRTNKADLVETPQGYYNTRAKRLETDTSGKPLQVPERKLGFPPRAAGTGGGATKPARVQSVRPLADGTMLLIMTDKSREVLTDSLGRPYKGADAARRAASLVGKLLSPIQTREERDSAVREGKRISDSLGQDQRPSGEHQRPLDAYKR